MGRMIRFCTLVRKIKACTSKLQGKVGTQTAMHIPAHPQLHVRSKNAKLVTIFSNFGWFRYDVHVRVSVRGADPYTV